MKKLKTILIVLITVIAVGGIHLGQDLDDATAMSKMKAICGTDAAIGKFRAYGDPVWTRVVGSVQNRTSDNPQYNWIASSRLGYQDAINKLPPSDGPHVITAVARDSNGVTALDSVTVFVCNPASAIHLQSNPGWIERLKEWIAD